MNGKYLKYLIPFFFIIFTIFGVDTARKLSSTYDESIHLVSGYSYFRTQDYRLNADGHPPFAEMWAAIPMVFIKPTLPLNHPYWNMAGRYQYPFADLVLYHSKAMAEKMLIPGRYMIMALALLLGFFIYLWSKKLYGIKAGIVSLFLWSFSSIFIAHGTLITTDMALCVFYFAVFYFLWLIIENTNERNIKNILLLGVSFGLLLASKYSSVIVFPIIAVILYFAYYENKIDLNKTFKTILLILAVSFAVLLITFQGKPLFTYYFTGVKKIFGFVTSGRSAYFWGKHSTKGWLLYFPAVFLIKTQIPFMVLCVIAFIKLKKEEFIDAKYLIIPSLIYFAVSCFSKVQIGHRHILILYPFLTVLASGAAVKYFKGRTKSIILIILLVWYGTSAIIVHPWHLSYFNEFVGTKNGYKYFTDSNTDWGQGLKELSKYLKDENVNGIYLSYFGTADPHYYKIKYVPIGFIDSIGDPKLRPMALWHRKGGPLNVIDGKKTLFAISITNLQATYYADKSAFDWLKAETPVKVIAHSIFVYDITGNNEALSHINSLLGIK